MLVPALLAALGGSAFGAAEPPPGTLCAITLSLPADFPTGLRVPVVATLQGSSERLAAVLRAGPTLALRRRAGREVLPAQILIDETDSRIERTASGRDAPRSRLAWIEAFRPGEAGREIRYTLSGPLPRKTGEVLLRPVERRGTFAFLEGDRQVLVYRAAVVDPGGKPGRFSRCDYIHPLLGLDGEIFTQDAPDDHPHHRGLFFGYPVVKQGGKLLGDHWYVLGVHSRFQGAGDRVEGPVAAGLELRCRWEADEDGRELLAERLRIRVFRSTAIGRAIEVTAWFQAKVDGLRVGGRPGHKGYGGFTLRVPRPADGSITMDDVRIEAASVDRKPARWSDYSGRFRPGGDLSGIAILDAPDNPPNRNGWSNRYYGMLNVAYPGPGEVDVPRDRPIRLHYWIWVHRGDARAGRVADVFRALAAPLAARIERPAKPAGAAR